MGWNVIAKCGHEVKERAPPGILRDLFVRHVKTQLGIIRGKKSDGPK